MAKRISKETLLANIYGKNATKRQKAFGYIRRNQTKGLGSKLLDWLKEADKKCDGSTKAQYWDAYEACMTLGALEYKEAIPYLEQKGRTPGAKDNLAAGMMFLKLSKINKADFSQIFSFLDAHYTLLEEEIYSTMEMAAYATVGNEKMVPSIKEQQLYLKYATNYLNQYHHHPTIGLIASSLAGFDKTLKQAILEHIQELGEKEGSYIKYYAEDAMQGKYNRYNPRA